MSTSLEDVYHCEGDKSSGFDTRTNGVGKTTEKMGAICGELVAAGEPTVVIKPLFHAAAYEGSRDGGVLGS